MSSYRVGFATVDITPPLSLGIRLGGYFRLGKTAAKVLDPICARAFCIRKPDDAADSIILVSCDLVGFQYRLVRIVRKVVSKRTGVPISNIMLHFTHSHSSPDTTGIFPNKVSRFFTMDVQYPVVKHLMKKMARAAIEAFNNATMKAKVGFGQTKKVDPPLSVQRRPPYTRIYEPIRFLKITDESDQLIGVIVNYQGHPTQLPQKNSDISAEYPGAVARNLYERYPGLKFACYYNGANGDVSIRGHKGYHYARFHLKKSYEESMKYALQTVNELGKKIVEHVAEAIDEVKTEPIKIVKAQRRFLFPVVGRKKKRVFTRLKYYHDFRHKMSVLRFELYNKLKLFILNQFYGFLNRRTLPMINVMKKGRKIHHQTELFVFRINDFYWLASPGEPFYVYQERLLNLIPTKKGFFSEMTESCGYIYPWSFYVKRGYEIFFSFDALFGEYLMNVFKEEIAK